jgi:hypothetical protein
MGLNYLLHRHQVSVARAASAPSGAARRSHEGLARGYARQIEALTRPQRSDRTPLVPIA